MAEISELSIEDLQQLIKNSPTDSACARASVEALERLLFEKQQELNLSIGDK